MLHSPGTLLPIFRDAGESKSPIGIAVTALGAVGEFGPLVAISLFFNGRELGPATAVLLGFVLLTGLAIYLASRARHSLLHSQVTRTLHTSGQFAVRSIIFILTVLVVLSMVLGLDMLSGAFAAGVLWKVAIARPPEQDRKVIEAKIDAIAFGFFGAGLLHRHRHRLRALTASPAALALVPLLLLLLLIIRGLPSLLAAPPKSSPADKRAIILFGATGLPIIVAVTGIGRDEGLLSGGIASALVGAGMLSVLLFPLLALRQHQPRPSATPARQNESPQAARWGNHPGERRRRDAPGRTAWTVTHGTYSGRQAPPRRQGHGGNAGRRRQPPRRGSHQSCRPCPDQA